MERPTKQRIEKDRRQETGDRPVFGLPSPVFFGGNSRNDLVGALHVNSAQLGLWVFLATVSMLFAGFTSAYLVRQAGSDWQPIPLPPILWFNTALLLLSSLTMEVGRAQQRQRRRNALKGWLLTGGRFFHVSSRGMK